MKKLLLLSALSLCFTGSFAQKTKASDDALDKKVLAVNIEGAHLATLEMEKELRLNQEQQLEVQELNAMLYQQLLTVKDKSGADKKEQLIALRNIHIENDKALKRILTEQQLKRYLELEGREHMNHLSELDNN